jgi:hypothetical protein
VAANVVSACAINDQNEKDKNVVELYKHSGVIALGGLRDILGPSFALALELAQGYTYTLPENIESSCIRDDEASSKTESSL